MDEIEKDIKRTRTSMSFFRQAVIPERNVTEEDIARLEMQHRFKKSDLSNSDLELYIEAHSNVLSRILFIYARLNTGIRYVQGMNEILAVLYYCFWNFNSEAVFPQESIETDVFYCFSNLMSEIKDSFMRCLDREENGIDGKCRTLLSILRLVD